MLENLTIKLWYGIFAIYYNISDNSDINYRLIWDMSSKTTSSFSQIFVMNNNKHVFS